MVEFYFFDTSAIVKRYTQEAGSAWVLEIIDQQPAVRIILSRITWVEVISALSRLRRERKIGASPFSREMRAFNQHFRAEYHIQEFNQAVSKTAGELVQRHRFVPMMQCSSHQPFEFKTHIAQPRVYT